MLTSYYDPKKKRLVTVQAGPNTGFLAKSGAPVEITLPEISTDEGHAPVAAQAPTVPQSMFAQPLPSASAPTPVPVQAGAPVTADFDPSLLPSAAPVAPAPARPNPGGGMMRKPLGAYYDDLERERGLPTGFLGKIRAIESANGTNLVNPRSSARGDFQFLRGTAKQYGINPMDPYQSARAAADMAAANARALRAKGIEPDGANLYGTHQQGLSGFLKLARGQSPGRAEMALNGGAGLSPSGFLAKWRTKYDAAKPANLGEGFVPPASAGANQGQGPTVEAAARGALAGPALSAAPTPEAVATAASPTPVDNTYRGGLLGLAGVGNPAAPGMDKGFLGKFSDIASQPGGGAIGGMAKALGALATQKTNRPGLTIAPMADAVHKPDASLLELLDPERRRRRAMGVA